MIDQQQARRSVKRAVIIGVGDLSIPTLYKLRQRLEQQLELDDVPVVASVCIRENTDAPLDSAIATSITFLLAADVLAGTADVALGTVVDHIMAVSHPETLLELGVSVDSTQRLEVVFVGSLEEVLCASQLVKIARAIYPLIMEKSGYESLPSVAFLSYPDIQKRPDLKEQVSIGLQHINDQLELQRSTARNVLAEKTTFALQKVYLLGGTNGARLTLKNDSALFWMTGDWLYYYLTSDAPGVDESTLLEGELYASLGYASLYVPEPPMRSVLTRWFVREAYNDYLLALPNLDIKQLPETDLQNLPRDAQIEVVYREQTQKDWDAERLNVQTLADELPVTEVSRPQLRTSGFANNVFYRYTELEKELAGRYSRLLQDSEQATSDLTKYVEAQRRRLQEIGELQVNRALRSLWKIYLDTPDRDRANYAPIQIALRFFERTQESFEQAAEMHRVEVQRLDSEIEAAHRRIQRIRSEYWDMAKFIHPPSNPIPIPYLMPIFAFLLALSLALYLGLVFIELLQQPSLAIAFIVITFLAGAVLLAAAILRAGQKKNDLIGEYAKRLDNIVKQHNERFLAGAFARFAKQIEQEYVDVLRKAEGLLQQELGADYHKQRHSYERIREQEPTIPPELEDQIYGPNGNGTPNYELEVSVVQREDLDKWYEELFPSRAAIDGLSGTSRQETQATTEDVKAVLKQFFAATVPLSTRVEQLQSRPLRPELEQWLVAKRLRQLKEAPISRYLKKYPPEQQREKIRLMIQRAQAYLLIDATKIGGERQNIEVIDLHFARQDDGYVRPLLDGVDSRIRVSPKVNENPLRIDTVARLRWISRDVAKISDYLPQMSGTGSGDVSAGLTDRITSSTMNMYELVALARVFGVIVNEGRDLLYRQLDERSMTFLQEEKYIEIQLGREYQVVVNHLQNPNNYRDRQIIYDQTMQQMQESLNADPSGVELGKQIYTFMKQTSSEKEQYSALDEYLTRLQQTIKQRSSNDGGPTA